MWVDIVMEDMIKCQVCLKWAHSVCAGVSNGLDVSRKVVDFKKLNNYHVNDVNRTPLSNKIISNVLWH